MVTRFKKILVFGDNVGLPQSLAVIDPELICGVVISGIRPQYHSDLQKLAKEKGLTVFIQPPRKSVDYSSFSSSIAKLNPDFILCNSYSMLIREDILALTAGNAVNMHWSLLPGNRGPHPSQWALIKGEDKTGVTLHYLSNGFDDGDIIAQNEEEIRENDTWVTLNARLENLAFDLLKKQIPLVLKGENKRVVQDEHLATKNSPLTIDYPKIDFDNMDDRKIFNLIRAQVKPLKGAFIEAKNGTRVYIDHYLSMEQVAQMRKKYV
jgi:methionyl-tRNA formyltransferase